MTNERTRLWALIAALWCSANVATLIATCFWGHDWSRAFLAISAMQWALFGYFIGVAR